MYETQKQVGRAGGAVAVPQQTLASRLETAVNGILTQSDRIENTLARINGTPRTECINSSSDAKCSLPLVGNVEALEALVERLGKLAYSLELVA